MNRRENWDLAQLHIFSPSFLSLESNRWDDRRDHLPAKLVLWCIGVCSSLLCFWRLRWGFNLNFSTFYERHDSFRKFVDDRRTAEMWTVEETRDNGFPAITHLLRSSLLCHHDANAGSSLLPPSLDFWRLSLPSFSICLLQQRLRQHAVDDSYDNQSIHSHHVSTPLLENLSDKVYHSSAVFCMVYLVFNHGELEIYNF